jgi:hypothetical protein
MVQFSFHPHNSSHDIICPYSFINKKKKKYILKLTSKNIYLQIVYFKPIAVAEHDWSVKIMLRSKFINGHFFFSVSQRVAWVNSAYLFTIFEPSHLIRRCIIYAVETASVSNVRVSKSFHLLLSLSSGHWDCPQGRKWESGLARSVLEIQKSATSCPV